MYPAVVLLFVAAALAAAPDAKALGFGAIQATATLGQPLNIAVPVRLEDGESLTTGCVKAEVMAGEQRIAPESVRVLMDPPSSASARDLRIVTSVSIDEPILTITLGIGCPTQLSRRIVAFADPPGIAMPSTLAQAEQTQAVVVAAAPVAPAPAAPVLAPRAAASAAAPSPRPRRPPRRAAPPAEAVAAAPARQAARTTPAAADAAPRARLRLEAEELSAAQAALVAAQAQVQAAAAAASAAQASASAAEARSSAVEQDMARLRTESQASRDAVLQMRERLAEAESRNALVPGLIALLGVLLALVLWLLWRLRRLSQERPPWWDAPLPASPAPVVPAAAAADAGSERTVGVPSAAPATVAVERPVERSRTGPVVFAPSTMPMVDVVAVPPTIPPPPPAPPPFPSLTPDALPAARESRREVSIDEQIDLEQQADFFIVLGQDEAAIDLLLTHLRGTGGTSPMPYLKLLDIHRRRGEREAYERARTRFNQRFNAVAPAWDADPDHGRALEDYPAVVERLQQAWWSPLDAMAELESLLFRRGEDAELFDLPAYQEVLALYQLARELHVNEAEEASSPPTGVDVLLPLADAPPDAVSVRHVDLDATRVLKPRVDVELPEALDLDLSGPPVPHEADAAHADSGFVDFELDDPAAPRKH